MLTAEDGQVPGSSTIVLKDVECVIGGRRIFNGLNLAVARGHITAIMGPRGTGKTRHSCGRPAADGADTEKKDLPLRMLREGRTMVKLLLVRHGHIEGIQPERFRGRTDVPLTPEGQRQAAATARRIAARWHPAKVYTSPLQRCVQTAAQIAAACGTEPVVEDDLNDLDYGSWQWHLHTDVRARWPELLDRWLASPHLVRFPGGESLQDLLARAADVVRMALERHPGETVALVSHDSVLRALLLQLLDQPLSAYWRLAPAPCSISEVEVLGNGARVIGINETQHLEKAPS